MSGKKAKYEKYLYEPPLPSKAKFVDISGGKKDGY